MRNHYNELDILRGLAIIGVVLIHVTSTSLDYTTSGSSLEFLSLFFNQISRFAVPTFFLLSGLGLSISKRNQLENGYFSFLKKRISKIITLYIGWTVIYFVLTSDSLSISTLIKNMIFGSGYYHLYYVPLIILCYIIYPLILKLCQSVVGVVILLVLTLLSQMSDELFGIILLESKLNIFNWICYFGIGVWFANKFDIKMSVLKNYSKTIIISTIVIFLGVFIESYLLIDSVGKAQATTSMRPSIILLSISFVCMIICIKKYNVTFNKLLLKFSNLSYGIYLSHALFLTIFMKIYTQLGLSLNSFIFILTALLFVIPISMIVSYLADKILQTIKDKGNKIKNKTIKVA
ncbi:acyltransferase [Niallia sp. FSL K6-0212]|uniref:acyltransferase n=1 Tax=Niallia sp. FSL K6-0212 TaxID=2921423 RepID=UPI0030F5D350